MDFLDFFQEVSGTLTQATISGNCCAVTDEVEHSCHLPVPGWTCCFGEFILLCSCGDTLLLSGNLVALCGESSGSSRWPGSDSYVELRQ